MTAIFPVRQWGEYQVSFFSEPAPLEAVKYAVIVFTWINNKWLVADIPDRGWCVPSGRMEPGETPEETAHREAHEETGAILRDLSPIGHYLFVDQSGASRVMPTFVSLVESIGPIPEGSESLGIRLLAPGELAANYWKWDDLLTEMFIFAENIARKLENS